MPNKPRLLFSAPYAFFPNELRERIETSFNVAYAFGAPGCEVAQRLEATDIWITPTSPSYWIDRNLLAHGKALRIVATPSTGTNHIDTAVLSERKIELISLKGSPVIEQIYASSEFSFALLLAMIKRIPFAAGHARQGVWREREELFRNREVHGMKIGLVGYGRIGVKMARFAAALGMEVLAFDPFKSITGEPHVRQLDTLEAMLPLCDIVALHYHLTPETVGSFGREEFRRMKPGAYFLNTARGELVDEAAMLEALANGHLAAAAVDVITAEHLDGKCDHPVIRYARENDHLLVTPHIAGCTVDSETKAMVYLIERILQADSLPNAS